MCADFTAGKNMNLDQWYCPGHFPYCGKCVRYIHNYADEIARLDEVDKKRIEYFKPEINKRLKRCKNFAFKELFK